MDDALAPGGADAGGAGGNGGTLQLPGSAGDGAPSGAPSSGGAPGCVVTPCRKKLYQCGNCQDDDGDGRADSEDPDCLGPCDDDETNLSTGLPTADTGNCRQDCYFDGDAGPGNDKCLWSSQCDSLSVAPDYPPSGDARCVYDAMPKGLDCAALRSAQDDKCIDVCLPLVPNGCDCFGCCELPAGSNRYRYLGGVQGSSGCELDAAGDPTNCPSCSPVPSCLNTCEKCESCVGRGPDPSCVAGTICPPGQAACTSSSQCDYREYCVTGCCVRAPEPT